MRLKLNRLQVYGHEPREGRAKTKTNRKNTFDLHVSHFDSRMLCIDYLSAKVDFSILALVRSIGLRPILTVHCAI